MALPVVVRRLARGLTPMARPGLFRHRKFARLTRAVKSPALAVGALELMWNACYESCDDRIGTAEDIVFAIQWTGRIDIVAALHDAGFIDEDDAHPGVYVVHDLWDHAPQYVLRRREREDKRESDGTTTRHRINARRQKLDTDKPLSSHKQAADKPLTSTPGTERYGSVQSVSEHGESGQSEAQEHVCATNSQPAPDASTGYVAGHALVSGRRGGLLPGRDPHAAYQCAAFVVPRFLHEKFRGRLANAHDADPEASLQAWYARLAAAIDGRNISGDDVKFLTAEFDAWRQPTPRAAGIRGKTDGNAAVIADFIAGGRA